MKIIEIEQGSPEWIELRRNKIGASEAGMICGVDPYKTALQLWEEKKGHKKSYTTKAMQRGHDLEPVARELIEKSHVANYKPIVIQSEDKDFMIASLDGYDIKSDRMIEIKCPKEETFDSIAQSGCIPPHWIYQMNHQMFVAELQECFLILFNGVYCAEFVVKRDNALIEEIIAKEEAFYEHMVNYTPPPGPLPKKEDLETMEAVLGAIKVRDKLNKKKEELKELEEEYDICKQALAFLSENTSFECKGYQIRKIISQGRVDYKKVPELKGVDLTPYRGEPTEYWRIV